MATPASGSVPRLEVLYTQQEEELPRLYYVLGGPDFEVGKQQKFWDALRSPEKSGEPGLELVDLQDDLREPSNLPKNYHLPKNFHGKAVFVQKHREDDKDHTAVINIAKADGTKESIKTHSGYSVLETLEKVERIFKTVYGSNFKIGNTTVSKMQMFLAAVNKVDEFNKSAALPSVYEDTPVYAGTDKALDLLKKAEKGDEKPKRSVTDRPGARHTSRLLNENRKKPSTDRLNPKPPAGKETSTKASDKPPEPIAAFAVEIAPAADACSSSNPPRDNGSKIPVVGDTSGPKKEDSGVAGKPPEPLHAFAKEKLSDDAQPETVPSKAPNGKALGAPQGAGKSSEPVGASAEPIPEDVSSFKPPIGKGSEKPVAGDKAGPKATEPKGEGDKTKAADKPPAAAVKPKDEPAKSEADKSKEKPVATEPQGEADKPKVADKPSAAAVKPKNEPGKPEAGKPKEKTVAKEPPKGPTGNKAGEITETYPILVEDKGIKKPLFNVVYSKDSMGHLRLDYLLGARGLEDSEHESLWKKLVTAASASDTSLLVRPLNPEEYKQYALPADYKGRIVLVRKLSKDDIDFSAGEHPGYDALETYTKVSQLVGTQFAIDKNAPANMKKFIGTLDNYSASMGHPVKFNEMFPSFNDVRKVLANLEEGLKGAKPATPKSEPARAKPADKAKPTETDKAKPAELSPPEANPKDAKSSPVPPQMPIVNPVEPGGDDRQVERPLTRNRVVDLGDKNRQKIIWGGVYVAVTGVSLLVFNKLSGIVTGQTLFEWTLYRIVPFIRNHFFKIAGAGAIAAIAFYALRNKKNNPQPQEN